MNKVVIGVVVAVIVVVGVIAGLFLLRTRSTSSVPPTSVTPISVPPTTSTTSSVPTSTSSSTHTSVVQSISPFSVPSKDLIKFYKYNKTYYVFELPPNATMFDNFTWYNMRFCLSTGYATELTNGTGISWNGISYFYINGVRYKVVCCPYTICGTPALENGYLIVYATGPTTPPSPGIYEGKATLGYTFVPYGPSSIFNITVYAEFINK
ncbi:hypothetical protein [Stygiolobus caldivivus]|uniref:Uncharacterized protein n=1 Tax=Stygiolobus caldivivus TaxID=2824673 RepID=A0A8D5U5R9_9CREN|nr:hypothetical protein [Stygiolobus caldivivus]BCU69814.1 hypothetical protein KN1_11110 [Stygiolobus caldivivus]